MLQINNTKRKLGVGLAVLSITGFLSWSSLVMSYTPNYAQAIDDPRTMADIEYMK